MNNLEKLYEMGKNLDKELKTIEIGQAKIEDEITKRRTIGWEKMFEDLYSLRKYSNNIDTGIMLYKSQKETLGFRLCDDYIVVISWEHLNCDGKKIEPRPHTSFFCITKGKPFEANDYKVCMKYVVFAIENWDEVMKEIEKRLSEQMELEIKKKISNLEQKQIELDKQLKAIS